MLQPQDERFSYSVNQAINQFSEGEAVSAWSIVQNLLASHSEYGGGMGGKLRSEPGPTDGMTQSVQEWLSALAEIFDLDKVSQIHGRMAILGLAHLDTALADFLNSYGFLEALEAETSEPFSAVLKASGGPTRSAFSVRSAGFLTDAIDPDTELHDRLNVEDEVEDIANILTSKLVNPPLSLGLFGDWGSGKSFFISLLRKKIDQVVEYYHELEKREGKPNPKWCTRVVHIDFNAWHFSDANLWASLVTRIYEGLYRELGGEKTEDELEQGLKEEFEKAEGVVAEAEAHLEQTRRKVAEAGGTLQTARQQVSEKEQSLHQLIDDLRQLLGDHQKMEQATEALGFSKAAETYQELQQLKENIGQFSNRFSALWFNTVRSPSTLLILALGIIGLPLAVGYALELFEVQIDRVGKAIVEISTLLFGIVSGIQVQIRRGMRYVGEIEKAYQKAKSVREKKITENEEVKRAQQALLLARSEEEAAMENLRASQMELKRLEAELQEFRPERKLFRLIEKRTQTATYTKHLGIISLIRSDFEKMSQWLAKLAREKRDLSKEPPPIQRIILYIDDLDRCRPNRVVEVLEAIHLLLAFPLFTVVVGVDPRWLRHSLANHYRETLVERTLPTELESQVDFPVYSTPQDYLEKIFQIPFALRPVEKDGFHNMVNDLLSPLPEPATDEPQAPSSGGSETAQPPPPSTEGQLPADDKEEPRQKAFVPIDSGQLEFQPWEEADIKKLWPLFRTPRTVKRFVNTYRLLRAGMRSAEEVTRFEGTETNPGQYQLAIVLLAMVTNFPDLAILFVQRLIDISKQKGGNASPTFTWQEVIPDLTNFLPDHPRWNMMVRSLEEITRDDFNQSFEYGELEKWAFRITRFSFALRTPTFN